MTDAGGVRMWPGVRIEVAYNPDAEAAGIHWTALATVVEPAHPNPDDGRLVVQFDDLDEPVEIRRYYGVRVVGGEEAAQAWEDAVFDLPDPASHRQVYYRVPVVLTGAEMMPVSDRIPDSVGLRYRTFKRVGKRWARRGKVFEIFGWADAWPGRTSSTRCRPGVRTRASTTASARSS
jgi:hypothetical protein